MRFVVTFTVTTMAFFADEWVGEWDDEWGNDDLTEGDYDMNYSNILLQVLRKSRLTLTKQWKLQALVKLMVILTKPEKQRVLTKSFGNVLQFGNVEIDLGKTGETMSADKVEVDFDKTEETASVDINIEADLGKTTKMKNSLNQGVAVGYVHNISPVKAGNYFEFVLQTKSKTVRAVCFSPPKRKSFFYHSSGPVQVKKFQIDLKSNNEDLLMGADVLVQPVANLDFPKVDLPKTTDLLSKIKSSYIDQLVTVKAKIADLGRVKFVKANYKWLRVHLWMLLVK